MVDSTYCSFPLYAVGMQTRDNKNYTKVFDCEIYFETGLTYHFLPFCIYLLHNIYI